MANLASDLLHKKELISFILENVNYKGARVYCYLLHINRCILRLQKVHNIIHSNQQPEPFFNIVKKDSEVHYMYLDNMSQTVKNLA